MDDCREKITPAPIENKSGTNYSSGANRCAGVLVVAAALVAQSAAAATGPAMTGLTAQADSAMAGASNPAALARLPRTEWAAETLLFLSESTNETTADFAPGTAVEDNDGSLFVPFLYYGRPLNERWSVGASLTAPGGFGEDPGDSGPGRYLLKEWTLIYVALSPAAAYRVNEQFSVGASLNLTYTDFEYESAVFNPEPGIGDGTMRIEADEFTYSLQFGLLWELSERTRLGLNYRSESESDLAATPEFSGLGPARQAALEEGRLGRRLEFETVLPQIVIAGVYHELGNGTALTLDVAWMEFSDFGMTEFKVGEDAVITSDQEFEDIWAASAGLSYPLGNRWTLKGGVAWTSEFIKDQNRTSSFRMDQIWGLGVGAEYRWGQDRIIGFNLNYFDLGDAPVENDIPLLGTIREVYTDRTAIGIGLSLRWLR